MLAFKDNIDCPHGVGPEGTCPLLAQCQSPGLPTRPADFGTTGRDIAILVIGEAPGYYEDRASKSWVGVSGDLLHRLLAAAKLPDRADIFLANAVRCHPIGNDKPGNRVLTTCRAHLEDDMQQLAAHYKTVYVLCTGAPAAFAAGHKTLKAAFSFQGYETEWFPGLSFRTFFTYHPAHLLPGKDKAKGRSPSHVRAVGDHLEFLWEVVTGKRVVRDSIIQPERRPPPPDPLPDIVAIDIETYGILKHFNQTVFHPRKSEVIDGIRRGAQIVTVALSWEDKPCTPSNLSPPTSGSQPSSSNSSSCSSCSFAGGTRERHAVFIWADARDRKILYEWMRRLESQGKTLLGKNILFDLMYLRYNSPVFRYWLDCTKRLRLEDIGVWNHLDYELRPEKSLKPLAELLGVASYGSLLVNAKDPANAERYLYHTWSKAKEWAIANPGEAILFARAAIEWATSRPWPGRTGATDRAVYLAYLSIVQKCGRQPYAASCRDLAELSGVSWDTASKATHRLRDGGLIELVQNATATFAHRYTLLATPTCTPNSHQPAPLPDTPPPKPCGGVSEEGASWGDSVPDAPIPTHSHTNLHLPLSLPQYTPVGEWQVKVQVAPVDTEHDTFRWYGLGKTGGEVLAALEAMEQGTVKEIIAATGRHRNTIQRKLKTMAELGMVERVSAYVWRFVGGDLDAAAEELGTSGVGERERQQHEQDRQDHRQSLEEGAKRVPAATAATGYRPGRVVVDTVTGEIL